MGTPTINLPLEDSRDQNYGLFFCNGKAAVTIGRLLMRFKNIENITVYYKIICDDCCFKIIGKFDENGEKVFSYFFLFSSNVDDNVDMLITNNIDFLFTEASQLQGEYCLNLCGDEFKGILNLIFENNDWSFVALNSNGKDFRRQILNEYHNWKNLMVPEEEISMFIKMCREKITAKEEEKENTKVTDAKEEAREKETSILQEKKNDAEEKDERKEERKIALVENENLEELTKNGQRIKQDDVMDEVTITDDINLFEGKRKNSFMSDINREEDNPPPPKKFGQEK